MIPAAQLILTGLVIGILISAPVGPVNILCVQRTLERGFWGGIAAGIGAVLADGVIATAAASGLAAISWLMTEHKTEIRLIGGAILVAFGIKLYLGAKRDVSAGEQGSHLKSHGWTVPQTFFLTITNPGAILGIFAIIGGAGSAFGGFNSYAEAFTMVLAVMGGGMLWWIGLARLITHIHHRLDRKRLRIINRIAGGALIGFGVLLLIKAATSY